MNFFGGTFFGGGFFGALTGGAGAVGGRKRRWALIDDRLYHATDNEIQELLEASPKPVEPVYVSKRVAKKIKQTKRVEVVEAKPTWDDEDDIEILLWH